MPSAYDCTHLGSPSLLRSPARLEPPLFVGSMTRMGSFLFAFDGAFLDSLLFLRSFAHLDPSLFAPSFSSLGSLSLLRNVACLESSVSVFGMVRCASSPFAFDFLHLGPALFLRSLAQLGPSTSALDCLLADFSILLRSFMRPDFCLLPRGNLGHGSLVPIKSSHILGSTLLVLGVTCIASLPPASDLALMGLLLLVQSFARSGFLVLILFFANLGFLLSLQSLA